jgi:hypothetical protein
VYLIIGESTQVWDKKVVKEMLQSVPDHLEQVVISMEMLLYRLKRRWKIT